MKRFRLIISANIMCAIVTLSAMSVTAVEAGHYGYYSSDKVAYMSDEEIFNEVWYEYYWSTFANRGDPLMMSIVRSELVDYLKDYEPLNNDTSISDVMSDFDEYGKQKYSEIRIEPTEDGYVEYNTDNPDEKLKYTYDETRKVYICKDDNGKIEKMYDRYFPENDKNVSAPSTSSSSASITSNTSGNYSNPTETLPEETQLTIQENNGDNITQTVILLIVGLLIVAGVIAIVVIKRQERKNIK
ncbi:MULTISPECIES: hypothetical protein [unclassified Ruminococcus]|uniref:hypothetical protein n=1 Tax=unclassified Ruminococcus TaxID=2608920 RepID=UPI002109C58B|nr:MULTISPECIES: hypothetical protein [unclassified Ruminococcus]MCQ4021720.1 hypothetical protein [Ruminococcus sp. zg-924]MCQ4114165.1 hypothetical protein [Ruminococcus sp. zg-921]